MGTLESGTRNASMSNYVGPVFNIRVERLYTQMVLKVNERLGLLVVYEGAAQHNLALRIDQSLRFGESLVRLYIP